MSLPHLPSSDLCTGCGACVSACNRKALSFVQEKDGFFYPKVQQEEQCTLCGSCTRVCPALHPSLTVEPQNRCFGVRAKETATRMNSSSGGVFPLLARDVLFRGGMVVAAGFDKDMTVCHQVVEKTEDLPRVLKTKYVQSQMGNAMETIRKALSQDREVLFVGTPCQAHALRLMFQDHGKLTICSLVCYGVPSPGVWKDYVRYLEQTNSGRLTRFDFRDKRAGDQGHTVSYVIGGKETAMPLGKDPYLRLYFKRLTIRSSCHKCPFTTTHRDSDLTFGDFWGVEKIRRDFYEDGMGVSLLIAHSPKGAALFERVRPETEHFSCQEQDCLQPRLMGPTPKSRHRGLFFFLYRHLPFKWLILIGRKR